MCSKSKHKRRMLINTTCVEWSVGQHRRASEPLGSPPVINLVSITVKKRNIHRYKYITYYKFYLAEGQLVTQAWPFVPGDPVDLHHKGELLLGKILNHHAEVLVSMTRH